MSVNRIRVRTVLVWFLLSVAILAVAVSCATAPATPSGERLKTMQQSPQWRDDKFNNTLEITSSSIWSMLAENFATRAINRTPKLPVPIVARTASDYTTAPPSGLRATWLGHSTVLIEIDGHRVLTDPVWGERASPFSFMGPKRFFTPPLPLDELPEIDVVIISHDHFDHLDQGTIEALREHIPLFVVPLGIGVHLEAWGVNPSKIIERDWWGEVRVGGLTLTATPARHFSGRALTGVYQNPTLWSGWAIRGPQHNVYYSGDTAMFPGFTEIGKRLGPFDLTMIELGAYSSMWPDVHIGPEQAYQAHKMVRGKVMMPVHWGTFDLAYHNWTEPVERLIAANGDNETTIVIPKPGNRFEPATPPQLVRWWPKLPWKTADEEPVISSGLGSDK